MKQRIGLIDIDSKQVNLALMKLSAYHKSKGDTVILNPTSSSQVDKVYCSVLFSWNREKALELARIFPNIEFGGTGYDLTTVLPSAIESQRPDYDLYSAADIEPRIKGIMKKETRRQKAEIIVNAGVGRSSTGCVRACAFCSVPEKEGAFRQASAIVDIINPKSKVITLLDNNLTADPLCLSKLNQIRDLNLCLDLTSGVDVRLVTPEIAKALSEVKHLRSLHYSWDLMCFEGSVRKGIDTLSKYVKQWRHLCYTLVGFDTSFNEDMYRFEELRGLGIDPYIMIFAGKGGVEDPYSLMRLKHFSRWVNGRIHKKCPDFSNYEPWIKAQKQLFI